MDKKTLAEKFKALSPYKNSIVRTPWDSEVVDVKTIHRRAFEKLTDALDTVKSSRASLIFVLQGEPGSGKSHFLWRVARSAESKKFLFVNIVPYTYIKRITFYTILESAVESLEKKHPNLRSRPIDHLIGYALQEGARLINTKALHDATAASIVGMIRDNKRMPFVAKSLFNSIPDNKKGLILNVMARKLSARYVEYPRYFFTLLLALEDKEKAPLALELMKGETLGKKELQKIGLDERFALGERGAFNVLCSLIKFSPFPFIISVDQVETLDRHLDSAGIERFFENILSIYNNTNNSLFLLSVQTQTFKKWTKFLAKDILDRLSERTTILPLNLEQAKEIVKARNRYYFGKIGTVPDDPYFPFTESQIETLYRKGNKNPRKLIKALDYLLESGELTEQKDTVQGSFKNYIRNVEYSDSEFRKEFTDLLAKIVEGSDVLKETPTYAILKLGKTGFAVNNSKHSLYSCVSHLSRFIRKRTIRFALLLRSDSLPVRATAKKTNELLRKHEIKVVYYSTQVGEVLITVSKMLRDAESGDLDIELKEVERFAREKIEEALPEVARAVFAGISEVPTKVSVGSRKPVRAKTRNNFRKNDLNAVEKQIEKILETRKIISYDKLLSLLKKNAKEVDAALFNLASRNKVRIIDRKYGEKWVFSGL